MDPTIHVWKMMKWWKVRMQQASSPVPNLFGHFEFSILAFQWPKQCQYQIITYSYHFISTRFRFHDSVWNPAGVFDVHWHISKDPVPLLTGQSFWPVGFKWCASCAALNASNLNCFAASSCVPRRARARWLWDRCCCVESSVEDHLRNLNWRYLPYIRPM